MAVLERRSDQETTFLRNKNREIVGSKAFNLEYDAPPTRPELRRDIVSYLGEYRLQVQKYEYELAYARQVEGRGPITLRDRDRGEPLQHMAKRVLEEKKSKHEPTHREEAEEEGLNFLNDALRSSRTGDTVLWASPPGPKEQGYGDYGFIYAGKVTKRANGEAHVAMTAIRIENPTIEGFNKTFSALSGKKIEHKKAEDFLSTPLLLREDISQKEIDQNLKKNFVFSPNPGEKEKFAAIIEHMTPLIDEFLDVIEDGTKAEKLKAFYTLENYALKLREDYREQPKKEKVLYAQSLRLHDLEEKYSYRPPVAKGSCGATGGGGRSNGLLSAGNGGEVARSIYGRDIYGEPSFECPSCGAINDRPKNELLEACLYCGSEEVAC